MFNLLDSNIRNPDFPVVTINWYMAAIYCNLLSKAEGVGEDQWCYEFKGQETKLKEKYLSLTGYRLPTEAEMEYATRAESVSSRYYGETDELLESYAWYAKNSAEHVWPVGLKKPNDFGLFDMQGNCFTWCQDSNAAYPFVGRGIVADDTEVKDLVIQSDRSRVKRGGSFSTLSSWLRSANRDNYAPTNRGNNYGMRLARTIPR